MTTIASFRLCTLSDNELLEKVDELTDKMYSNPPYEVPYRHIPARPNEDYDLLIGELLLRFKEKSPLPAKVNGDEWKQKFEDWLINNLHLTSKSNVQLIIDHVERYIVQPYTESKEVELLNKTIDNLHKAMVTAEQRGIEKGIAESKGSDAVCEYCEGKGWFINEDHPKYPEVEQKMDCHYCEQLPVKGSDAVDNWVSVKNEKPPLYKNVICYGGHTDNRINVCWRSVLDNGTEYYQRLNSDREFVNVTHWMPLPIPPKQ